MDIEKERETFGAHIKSTYPMGEQLAKDCGKTLCELYSSEWETWLEAKAQAVPDGFVVVPKEPTKEMLDAGMGNFDFPLDNGRFSNHDLIFAYSAMIAAAQGKKE